MGELHLDIYVERMRREYRVRLRPLCSRDALSLCASSRAFNLTSSSCTDWSCTEDAPGAPLAHKPVMTIH